MFSHILWVRRVFLLGLLALVPWFSMPQVALSSNTSRSSSVADSVVHPPLARQATDPCVPSATVDLVRDGIVDLNDINRVAVRWPLTNLNPDPDSDPSTPNYEARFDPNVNGKHDVGDLILIAKELGKQCSFGVQMFDADVNDAQVRDLAASAGSGFVRVYVSWGGVEGTQDNYSWGGLDTLFKNLNDDGLIPMATVTNNPLSWAASTTCGPHDKLPDFTEFAEFMGKAAERYDGDGYLDAPNSPQVHNWELYNEQDQVSATNNAGGCWGDDTGEYAQMMADVWDEVHDANPQASVIFGGVAYEPRFSEYNVNFLSDTFSNMPTQHMERVSFHQYDAYRIDWDGTRPQNQGVLGKAEAINDLLSLNGLGQVGLTVSEIGLQIDSGPSGVDKEERQARHVVREMTRALAGDMHPIIWYTFVDEPFSGFRYGLLDSSLDPRDSYDAFRVMTQQLKDMQPDGQVIFSGADVNSGVPDYVQVYRFVHADGTKKLVLFTDDGDRIKSQTDHPASVVIDASTFNVPAGDWTGELLSTNKEGNPSPLGSPGSASVTVDISQDPIYLEIAP